MYHTQKKIFFTNTKHKNNFYNLKEDKVKFFFVLEVKSLYTVKPVYNGHPWDSKKVAVVQKWSLFRGWTVNIEKLGIKLVWPLQTSGCCSEVAIKTGLTVLKKMTFWIS